MVKKLAVLFFFVLAGFSCKDKKEVTPAEEPQPQPPARGVLSFYITAYDSLGGVQQDAGGVKVDLIQTGQSAVTNSAGTVSFSNVPYGLYTPVLTRNGYEGPPLSVTLNSEAMPVSLPLPQHSTYLISNLTGSLVSPDSITLVFKFNQPIPAGKFCRLAVLSGATSTLDPNHYGTADIITTTAQSNTINIAQLPAFRAALSGYPANTPFYVGAVAISYGLYQSNLFPQPVLLGENLYYPNNLNFNKNW